MAQFWLKIAHLSFSIATTPLLKMIPSSVSVPDYGSWLKLILYTSFEVITGFLCPFNRRIRFKTQFHAIISLVEKTFQTANKQGRAERKLLHVKMSSGATYAVRRTP